MTTGDAERTNLPAAPAPDDDVPRLRLEQPRGDRHHIVRHLGDEDAPRVEIGASRTKHGTVAAVVVSYFNSWAFRNLADETRRTRKNILERFR